MKSYTNLEQSRKLSEILPPESADMRYGYIASYEFSDRMYDGGYDEVPYPKDFMKKNPNFSEDEYDGELPCWSLAALLDNIPQVKLDSIKQYDKKLWRCYAYFASDWHDSDWYDNPVDACVKMIIKLHELNLL